MPNLGFSLSGFTSPNANFGFQTSPALSPNIANAIDETIGPPLGAIENVDPLGQPLGVPNISQQDFNALQDPIEAINPLDPPVNKMDPYMTITPPLNTFMPDKNVIAPPPINPPPPTPPPTPIAFPVPVTPPPQTFTIPNIDKPMEMLVPQMSLMDQNVVNPLDPEFNQPAVQDAYQSLTQISTPEGYEQAFAAPMSMADALNATLAAMNPTMTAPAEESDTSDTGTQGEAPGFGLGPGGEDSGGISGEGSSGEGEGAGGNGGDA